MRDLLAYHHVLCKFVCCAGQAFVLDIVLITFTVLRSSDPQTGFLALSIACNNQIEDTIHWVRSISDQIHTNRLRAGQ
jgi:hypothetical protein